MRYEIEPLGDRNVRLHKKESMTDVALLRDWAHIHGIKLPTLPLVPPRRDPNKILGELAQAEARGQRALIEATLPTDEEIARVLDKPKGKQIS
ncbi:hypothetical protein HY383_01420 [Candidatus Daviesbacteria bacterium]|nr:hypothetical protein [Candidatus Daviesbacteria bacterium]